VNTINNRLRLTMTKPTNDRFNHQINAENIDFLQKLTGKEQIGVDQSGRLYQLKGFSQISSLFISKIKVDSKLNDVIQSSLKEMAENQRFTVEKSSEKFKEIISYLTDINAISNTSRDQVMETFYHTRLNLLRESHPELVAQATVSIEMSYDPLISARRKAEVMPIPTTGGTSGSYFIKNLDGNKIGVFKPMDEEVFMPNNPVGKTSSYNENEPKRIGPRMGHEQGSSWKKEIFSYLIDKGEHANVPFTTELSVPFPLRRGSSQMTLKKGSIQEFNQGFQLLN
jgi:hypothetical protein